MKRVLWVLVALLAFSVAAPTAFALSPTLTVSPTSIAPNGIVTISICNPPTVTDQVKYVSITTPSGTIWNSTEQDFTPPTCSSMLTYTFGGLSLPYTSTKTFDSFGWHLCVPSSFNKCVSSPPGTTQTGENGIYVVNVQYTHVKGGTEQFSVTQNFNVPEFSAPLAVVTALGLVGFALTRRLVKPALK
jgi:hypothetical protein